MPDSEAFTAYEHTMRGFVEQNQALATMGSATLAPRSQELLDARNEALRDPSALTGEEGRAANTGLTLPDYGRG
ncbi:hypothetical protein AB0B50_02400 [Streptomyces sp. NPDC041068]|uniref:hypothetical protein n=1 Tax=Streptomyces sp. NPDC041068 TaxID=3155130 RepID=UPI0033C7E0F0